MPNHAQSAPSTIKIDNVSIRQDAEGRYCLNDLHKASGGSMQHQPTNYIRLATTKELIEEIERSSDLMSVNIIKGKSQGTYVVKELVYAYAMWISPKFHISVIRAYDALNRRLPSASSDAPYLSIGPTDSVNYAEADCRLKKLRQWASANRHSDIDQDLAVIQRCLTSAWTEMDEALFKIRLAASFMQRWRT